MENELSSTEVRGSGTEVQTSPAGSQESQTEQIEPVKPITRHERYLFKRGLARAQQDILKAQDHLLQLFQLGSIDYHPEIGEVLALAIKTLEEVRKLLERLSQV